MAVDTAFASTAQEGKYLTFVLGNEEYGLEILKVQEINSLTGITPVPRSPGYVRGVINLRGGVIPIICLREYFRMSRAVDTEKTCVIVVHTHFDGREITLGLVVDEVSEVLNIGRDQIDEAPAFGGGIEEADFITGMGKMEDRLVILLDLDRALDRSELLDIVQSVAR